MKEAYDLLNSKSFQIKNNEKRIVYTMENSFVMLLITLFFLGLPISLLLLTKVMGTISAAISVFASSIGLIFGLFFALPIFGQFLRGKCVLKIVDGNLKNHKKSVPIEQIQSVKIRKHPNPLKLWIFDYLVITDVKNKKHYFNLYNLVNYTTVLLMIDVYVFNKKEL